MAGASFMGIDISHEKRGAEDLDRDPEFMAKLAYDCGLRRLAEIDCAAERASAIHTSGIIKNFDGKKLIATPVQAEGFEADSGCRASGFHVRGLLDGLTVHNVVETGIRVWTLPMIRLVCGGGCPALPQVVAFQAEVAAAYAQGGAFSQSIGIA